MGQSSDRRQRSRRGASSPAIVWLLLIVLATTAAASAAMGVLAYQEARQVELLQAELAAQDGARQATGAQVANMQATAVAMEKRLADLEANNPAEQLAALQAAVEKVRDPGQVVELRTTLAELEAQVGGFQDVLDALAARIDALEMHDTLPVEAHLDVPRQRQSHNLSCESSAASMVAQYHGVALSEAEVLASLPRNDNPHLGFRGDVDGPVGELTDYGVYADPVMALLNGRGLLALPVRGGLPGIKAAIVRGNPVIAWVTYDCQPGTPTVIEVHGEKVTLVPYQHVVVVTGYDDKGVWANDPWDGKEDYYPVAEFERAMGYFDDMAIEVGTR